MKARIIQFGDRKYPYVHGIDCTGEIARRIARMEADRYVLVVDSAVTELHAKELVDELEKKAPVLVIEVAPTELGKSLDRVQAILEEAFAWGMTRRSVVLAMGGGVVGNMAGLAAALAFRGVPLVHLPTTLMSAFDSVLSLKQAVNGKLGKNLMGTYYVPSSVYVDLRWLTTLPVREMRSGLCELVKNALAISPETVETLSRVLRIDCRLDAHELASLVDIAIDPKMKVMAEDEREKGSGLILEYGHTIGHALELASPGLLSHGEAVGVGMLCAAEIANRAYQLSDAAVATHVALLSQIGVTRDIARSIPMDTVLRLLRFDNKRGYLDAKSDQLPMILLDGIGTQRLSNGSPLTPVPFSEVERTVYGLVSSCSEIAAEAAE